MAITMMMIMVRWVVQVRSWVGQEGESRFVREEGMWEEGRFEGEREIGAMVWMYCEVGEVLLLNLDIWFSWGCWNCGFRYREGLSCWSVCLKLYVNDVYVCMCVCGGIIGYYRIRMFCSGEFLEE